MELKFRVLTGRKNIDLAEVRYDCACGCRPTATYARGSGQAGSQHCCCGIVHFVGPDADAALRGYLDERKAKGMDELVKGWEFKQASVRAPWGTDIEVAYAMPRFD